ncbi:MAG: hypothetical protein HZB50_04785 [Chloroflexi bacterium]|nr:hypothetical protein [Chloroflexota bacterium]
MTEPIEPRLQALAKEFKYPPTPSGVDAVMSRITGAGKHSRVRRQFAWALTMLIVLLAGLMFVPPVRAAVLEFIQVGIVRIFPAPAQSPAPTNEFPVTATPASNAPSLIPLLEKMAGETTLEKAQAAVEFSISLPVDFSQPDRVFLQNAGGWMLILVWLDPQQPDHVQMSLHMIEEGSWTINKYHPTVIEETTVHGQRALWTSGPYPLVLSDGNVDITRMINGHVLIWEENKITYRLETDLDLDEALRIAESLQVLPTP